MAATGGSNRGRLSKNIYLLIIPDVRRKPGALVPLEYAICETAAGLHRSGIEEFHGYELAKRLGDIADKRLLTAYGTLYRALGRMEQMGLLKSRWEDPAIPARENGLAADCINSRLPESPCRSRSRSGRRVHRPPRPETARLRLTIMLRLALALVRLWTTLYTSGMPRGLRETRRAEIESDLWESQHDRRPESDAGVAAQMLLRLCAACLTTCCGGSN